MSDEAKPLPPDARIQQHGGWLRTGGNPKAGRKPQAIRQEMMATIEDSIPLVRSILDGKFMEPVYDRHGKKIADRPANISEVIKALEYLARHSMPSQNELSGVNGGPIESSAAGNLQLDRVLDAMPPEAVKAFEEATARVRDGASALNDELGLYEPSGTE